MDAHHDLAKMVYKGCMSPPKPTDAMRGALHFLMHSDIPAQHKRVLIEVVAQAMRDADTAARESALEPPDAEWQPHEATALQAFLEGKNARSWQHADETLMRLATELHRRPHSVRLKATELGLGAGVDYGLAQQQRSCPRGIE